MTQTLRRWAINILVVLVVFSAVRWWGQREMASGPAPPLDGVMADGTVYMPPALQTQGVRLVHFWANWCPVCGMTQTGIDDLARTEPVMTVALRSGDPNTVSRYLRQHGLTHPVIVDESGELASRWGVHGIPASFIVDSQNRIRYRNGGFTPAWELRMRLWWYRWLDR